MALTPAQKQKKYRARQKLKAGGLLPEIASPPTLNLPNVGFSDFILADTYREEAISWIEQEMENINPVFLLGGGIDRQFEIERTYRCIESLTTSLETVTGLLNEFRVQQIDQEIAKLTKEDLAKPAKQEDALARILQLSEARKRLAKKYRLELSEFEIPGE